MRACSVPTRRFRSRCPACCARCRDGSLNPLGPLSVTPGYFPRALPWLLRWIEAGRLERVIAISDAMRALHRESLTCWQELLGPSLYGDLIRPLGQVQVWEGDGETANSGVERQVRERHGIKSEALSADDLRQMFPGISRDVTRGLLVPGNGHTVSPQRSVVTLGDLFRKEGGTLINERAMKLIPREGGGWMVMTNLANRSSRSRRRGDGGMVAPVARSAGHQGRAGNRARLPRHAVRSGGHAGLADQQQDAGLRGHAHGGRAARGRHGGDRGAAGAAQRGTGKGPGAARETDVPRAQGREGALLDGVPAVHARQPADPRSRPPAGPDCISFSVTATSA